MQDAARKQRLLRWTTSVFGSGKERRETVSKGAKGIGHSVFEGKESRLS
jgi:hypothetical protein